jgi:hypothetical protein
MKVAVNIIKHSPNNIEKIELEDVASYEVTDTEIRVKFNGSADEIFPLLNDQEKTRGEWFGIEMFATRIGLKIDMTQ